MAFLTLRRDLALPFQLRDKFVYSHAEFEASAFALYDLDGMQVGYVDKVRRRGQRLFLSGWAHAETLTLESSSDRSSCTPDILRSDVAARHGGPEAVGFELEAGAGQGPARLIVQTAQGPSVHEVPAFTPRAIARGRRAARRRFLKQVAACWPEIRAWLKTRDPLHRTRILIALGLEEFPVARQLGPIALRGPEEAPVASEGPLTVILPVYNALDLLPEALDRLQRHTDLPYRLIMVEDCSSDPNVRPFLKSWLAAHPDVDCTLIENPKNLGFIGAVNRAFSEALPAPGPVVLLNSDAFVPANWASRLVAPLIENPAVASVTPLSNDAEIFSVPRICQRSLLQAGQGDAIDAAVQQLSYPALADAAPTGVGFCMALNPAFLAQIPQFDTAFGKGYGEEVDWCQKTRQVGGRHVLAPNLFVEHRGGASFGSAEKRAMILANNARIAERYPTYDAEVQQFIQADPFLAPRLAGAIAWAGSLSEAPVPIYLAHSLGGGAERYLKDRIKRDIDALGAAVILRVGGPERWQIEVHGPLGVTLGSTDSFEAVALLLGLLPRRALVYSCGVGDPDPVSLPDAMLSLFEPERDTLDVLFHDFLPISPSYTLLNTMGRYEGPVTVENEDPAHRISRPDGQEVDLSGWQAAWGKLIASATDVTVFSQDSRQLVAHSYPGATPKIRVVPHELVVSVPRIAPPKHKGQVVAVLGNIGLQKGAAFLQAFAAALEDVSDLRLVLIGNIDPAYRLPDSVAVHGDYEVADLPSLVDHYGITDWLIPSIWPETFSYTTHEALASGMPVFCFDIGAQGEAVRAASNGCLIIKEGDGEDAGFASEDEVVDATIAALKNRYRTSG